MWVFDGEQWTYDGGGDEPATPKSEPTTSLRIDQLVPELQVIEIVQIPNRNTNIPPFPLP